jgi:uncharacterized membrane protein
VPIVFSDHARKQLKERYVSKKRTIEAVRNPDKVLASFKNRRLRQRRFGDRILEVVTVTEGSRITVVTSYYLKK